MSKMNFLSSLNKKDLRNKICLLRVDFNIQDAEIRRTNAELRKKKFSVSSRKGFRLSSVEYLRVNPRILAVLPTIKFLLDRGARVVILSHRGRPLEKSKVKSQKSKIQTKIQNYEKYTLKPFTKFLSKLLNKPVHFISFDKKTSFIKAKDIQRIRASTDGNIFLLENLRFLVGEEKNDKKFAERLASLGDFYVNDAFAVSHRKNASVCGITEYLPSYAGLLLEKEISNLIKVARGTMRNKRGIAQKRNKKSGLVIILGGAKISDKIGVIKNFQKKADYFLIGGGMANTFLAAQELPVGDSLYEKEAAPIARKFLKFGKIILPTDTRVFKKQILDIGPKTVEKYSKIIKNAKTIVWNGPMGHIEDKRFRKGSEEIAKAILKSKGLVIIGGGETAGLLKAKNSKLKVNIFISTGGGAMLEYLAGKKLPGIEALK
jgi:phosphoglycerate kinase